MDILRRKQGALKAKYLAPNYNVLSLARSLSLFFDRPKKDKIVRGYWALPYCRCLSNPAEMLDTRSQKCLIQSEAKVAILVLQLALKLKLSRECRDLAICQVLMNYVQRLQRRSQNSSADCKQMSCSPSSFSVRRERMFGYCFLQVSLNSVQRFERKSRNFFKPTRGQGDHLGFPISQSGHLGITIGPKLRVKFC